MSIDVGHIVKHNFLDFNNREAKYDFVQSAIASIKKFFCIQEDIEPFWESYGEEEDEDISIILPGFDIMDIKLHHGFWYIDTAFRFSQYIYADWLRQHFFDLTRALGNSEGWTCDEYHSWNCAEFDIDCDDFNKWIAFAQAEGIAPCYKVVEGHISDNEYRIVYDDFKDLEEELSILKHKHPEYIINSLSTVGNKYLRAIKEGNLFLIDKLTGVPLLDTYIDGVYEDLNGSAFEVRCGNRRKLIGYDGQELTDFVDGKFEWAWGPSETDSSLIFNKTAKIMFCATFVENQMRYVEKVYNEDLIK